MQTNRRQFHRFSGDPTPCVVTMDSVKLAGDIIDESIAGAGISGLDILMIPFSKTLTVSHRDETFQASARRVVRQHDGRFNLGVVRLTASPNSDATQSSAMLVNCYVKLRNSLAICAPLEFENDTDILIQLWDGMRFRVKRAQLISLTRQERFEMLDNEVFLKQAVEMYGLPVESTGQQQVFEYEFGTYCDCSVMQHA